jgi:hypothetical protein
MSNRNPRNQHLLSQISEKNPLKSTVAERAFDIGRAFDRDVEAIGIDRNLSQEGKKGKAKARAHKALLELQDAQKLIDGYHRETESMRSGIKVPSYDKTDVVGAMNRRELRDRSVHMSFGQHTALMSGQTRDPNFIDAVMELPAWASGFDLHAPNVLELWEAARQSRLRDLNGSLMDALEARATVESEAAMAVNIVLNDIQSDATDLSSRAA